MIQRVLIPTDFTVNSLRIVLEYLENSGNQQVELVLTCGYNLGESISFLLGFTLDDHLAEMQNGDFLKGCEIIKSRFKDKVVEMYADFMISKNRRYVRNYLKGCQIAHIVVPDTFEFQHTKNSFDVVELLKTTVLPNMPAITPVCMGEDGLQTQDTLDGFFFRKKWRFTYE
ncbi:hypothetical protein FXV77_19865 [Sphingobacterium phlebotomi]|uniref:Universal stress protein family protein n=1 Tax=Sphingobacterium phlebotomi TaxID=2605433 RepID=A0A5D4GV44_9SPHI|nr:hypothetical protein [Sphingobacterium phlebotomi]TYR32257.1 hypothetical protein FXV77_19865 [Sphingobacterium phlebotomi]